MKPETLFKTVDILRKKYPEIRNYSTVSLVDVLKNFESDIKSEIPKKTLLQRIFKRRKK